MKKKTSVKKKTIRTIPHLYLLQKIAYYIFLFLFFSWLSISVSSTYQKIIVLPNRADRITLHKQIIASKAPSPYRYRVLYPYITEGLIHLPIQLSFLDLNKYPGMEHLSKVEYQFAQAWYFQDTIAIFAIFLSLFIFLKDFPLGYRLLSGFLVAKALNAVLIGHAYQPWSLIEGSLFPFALLLAKEIVINNKGRWYKMLLGFVIILACFNRETGIFLPVFFFITIVIEKKYWHYRKLALLFFVFALGIILLLRVVKGGASSVQSINEIFHMNLSGANLHLFQYEFSNMFAAFWIPIFMGSFSRSREILKYLLLFLIYLPFYLIFGLWGEVRLLIPMIPVFLYTGFHFIDTVTKEPLFSSSILKKK